MKTWQQRAKPSDADYDDMSLTAFGLARDLVRLAANLSTRCKHVQDCIREKQVRSSQMPHVCAYARHRASLSSSHASCTMTATPLSAVLPTCLPPIISPFLVSAGCRYTCSRCGRVGHPCRAQSVRAQPREPGCACVSQSQAAAPCQRGTIAPALMRLVSYCIMWIRTSRSGRWMSK